MDKNDQNIEIPVWKKFSELIEKLNITSISIANRLQISRSHLSRVLSGKRELSEQLRQKLNEILGVTL
jgi:transcriptional regulator with XRE-family HTH domain